LLKQRRKYPRTPKYLIRNFRILEELTLEELTLKKLTFTKLTFNGLTPKELSIYPLSSYLKRKHFIKQSRAKDSFIPLKEKCSAIFEKSFEQKNITNYMMRFNDLSKFPVIILSIY